MRLTSCVLLAAALVLAPLGARAADLVVWWEKGFYAQEDEAVREIIAAFEQETGKQVELVLPSQDESIRGKTRGGARGRAAARLPVRHRMSSYISASGPTRTGWSTSRTLIGRSRTCSIRMRSTASTLLDAKTGQRGLYALPMGRATNHVHVWKSLLEQAGFTLADIPKEWEAFWSFWCDQVQPAVRKATRPRRHLGRRPAHVGRGRRHAGSNSCSSCSPTRRHYVTRDGQLVIDDPGDQAQADQGASTATPRSTARAAPRPTAVELGRPSATTRRSWRRRSS